MEPQKYFLKDDGVFPNSKLPVLVYKNALKLPAFFAAQYLKKLLQQNGWTNNWQAGIYTFNHYHSTTHEVFGVYKGSTSLLLGGPTGITVKISKGDLVVIPAGVAHKNLGTADAVCCVGGYPDGRIFDINRGDFFERPRTDVNIASLPVPVSDPLTGTEEGLPQIWRTVSNRLQEIPVYETAKAAR